MRVGLVVLAVTGCGRIAFAPLDDVGECTPGAALVPARVYNASVFDPVQACGIENVLARDDVVAGLDLIDDTSPDYCADFDGNGLHQGCGCVGVDLGTAYPVIEVIVRAAMTDSACGLTPCSTCGVGDTFTVWGGTELGVYHTLDGDRITSTLADYATPVAEIVRYVLVCRAAWGASRSDVAVDHIAITCM